MSNKLVGLNNKFITLHADGNDWREVATKFVKECEKYKDLISSETILFLYITDNLSKDCQSIITLINSVMDINNIFGTVSPAIFNNKDIFTNEAAMIGMIANFPENSVMNIPLMPDNKLSENITESSDFNYWMDNHDPRIMLIHTYPEHENDIILNIEEISDLTNSFLAGAVTISRDIPARFIGNEVTEESATAMIFSDENDIYSFVSQGCETSDNIHIITSCEDNIIKTIDDNIAMDVLLNDMGEYIEESIDLSPDNKIIKDGDIQLAFLTENSDYNNYFVRAINSVDSETGAIKLGRIVNKGDRIKFVHRNIETIKSDLTKNLVSLRERIIKEKGVFAPKGGIYISCLARTIINDDYMNNNIEIEIINEIIGEDVPIIGFYAAGEISNRYLYGFTGLLILFV